MELTGSVVLDTNHSLAGKALNFEIEIVRIKKGNGTQKEIVEPKDAIEVHYTGREEATGIQFDSSHDRGQTLPFTVGAWQMIAGFDSGVVGMKLWETKTLIIAPELAYGIYDESKKQVVRKKDLVSFVAAGYNLEVGEKIPTQYGELEIVEVIED